MPRCPAGAMDEGPVDLRTRPKAAGPPGAALPLRKRPLRAPSPEPAAPRGAAGPVVTPDPLGGGSDSPAVPAAPHGLARPEALYYQGPLLPLYPTPTMGSLFPLLNVPTPLYPMVCSMEHPLSADIAVATRADEDGDTPLHIAVVQGNLPAVHRLVNLFQHGGRELDIYNNLRQTPLHLAVITTLPSVVRLLVMAGASPMALDRHGQTAAHLACEHRSPTCLRALLDSAAPGTVDLEARNYDGLTALHVAVNMECPEAVLLLLERGADIDAVDIKSGRSPLIHAVENNSLSMVQLLLQHGANVNAQMYSGSSALHSASGRGLLPLVRTLVRSGADSGLKNCHNDTPLMVARSRRVSVRAGRACARAPVRADGTLECARVSVPVRAGERDSLWVRGSELGQGTLRHGADRARRDWREGEQRGLEEPGGDPCPPTGHRHPEGEGDQARSCITARALAGPQCHHLP
uniref:BCL3 transcription coactivator n=1 Tax=Lynx canadensis TaxID=61383 RepID=A0A667I714_LYNCA